MSYTHQEGLNSQIELHDRDDKGLDSSYRHQETTISKPTMSPEQGLLISAFASDTKIQIMKKFWRLYAFGLAVSLGGMYAGYCQNAVGNIVANPGFIRQFGTVTNANGELELAAIHVSLWSGFQYVGQIVFQAISPFISDRFGRRIAMFVLLLLMLTWAVVLEIVARDWKLFLVAKIFAGASNAFLGTAVMTYMSEIAIPQVRGALLSSFALSFGLGQLLNAVGFQILAETAPQKYLNGIYSQFTMLGLFGIVSVVIPESPVWLCLHGKHDKAKRALRRLVGNVKGYDLDHEYACITQEIHASNELTKAHGSNDWVALFKWVNFKRCIAATLPFSYQNFVGTPLVFGQTTFFFQIAGLDNPFLASTIIQVILIVGIITSFYVVERVGRRTLVLWGGAVMGCIDLAIGGIGFKTPDSATGAGLITVCSFWVLIYSLSLAPIGWVSVVEISSPRLRAKTAAVATIAQSLSNILFSYTVPLLISPQEAGWGSKIGLFFGGLTFLFWIPCYFLFPETKGRTYAELDELYEAGVSPRRFAQTRTSAQDAVDAREMEHAAKA